MEVRENWTAESSKFLGGRERQTTFAIEEPAQPFVLGTARAPNDFGRNPVAQLATIPPPFQPIFVADGAFNRDARGFRCRVHRRLLSRAAHTLQDYGIPGDSQATRLYVESMGD